MIFPSKCSYMYKNYIIKHKLPINWNLDFCIAKFIIFKSFSLKVTKQNTNANN